MDQSLSQFRAAIQKALKTGDSSKVATEETRRRLGLSRGWVSARSVTNCCSRSADKTYARTTNAPTERK